MTVLPMPLAPPIADRLSGRPFVALLDVDGTLAPITRRPEQAVVPDDTRNIIAELTTLPQTMVVVVSGRAALDAASVVGVPGVWIIGNHGLETAAPNEAPRPRHELARYIGAMSAAMEQFRAYAHGHPGVLVEDKRWSLSVHYRLVDSPAVADVVTTARTIAERLGLRATNGRRVVEIRPPIEVDKGTASLDLLRALGATSDDASIFCAGDDRTDEDMFRRIRAANPRAVTVRVLGAEDPSESHVGYESLAELTVPDPEALRAMLSAIVDLRRQLSPSSSS
jgi:trehalose-phosphatase